MKITGMALLLISSAMTGQWMASRLSRRAYLIERSISMLFAMSERLRCLRTGVRPLLRTLITQYPELDYLSGCLDLIGRGKGFSEGWRESVGGFEGIGDGEREILRSLGDTLGVSELENQLAAIGCARTSLAEKLEQAKEDSRSHGGLYRSLGALGGLALAVILY